MPTPRIPTTARTLDDIHRTTNIKPLIEADEFKAFYYEEFNSVRGPDRTRQLARDLRRGAEHEPFALVKLFLLGHAGVGKSTELTRLSGMVEESYVPIRVRAVDLNPYTFQPFDVVLLMLTRLTTRMQALIDAGTIELGRLPNDLFQEVLRWFAKEETATTEKRELEAKLEAGLGLDEKSWLAPLTGLFGKFSANARLGSTRENKLTEYRFSQLADLIALVNKFLLGCRDLLRSASPADAPREWLFIVEDFEKAGFSPDALKQLFSTYSNVLADLETHFIFVLPVELCYSDALSNRPMFDQNRCNILDTPVYRVDHTAHEPGRQAVRSLLAKRVDPTLFEDGQEERCVVASGGNLRDLFIIVAMAAEYALDHRVSRMGVRHITRAVEDLRRRYDQHLFPNPHESDAVPYPEKIQLLTDIYEGKPDYDRGVVFHSLLRARAIQEFDDPNYFGVHPLVVDTLYQQGKIHHGRPDQPPGGTI